MPTVHYFSAGRNSSFSYYVFVCLDYHVIIVCLCALYLCTVIVVCLCVCLFVHFSAFLLFHLLKYYFIVFNHCVKIVCLCVSMSRVAVVIMCLHFCKFIMSKIVCLCVCLHGFNYSIVVY